MDGSVKLKLVAGTAAVAAVAGGGVALAADHGGSPAVESQAVVNDAASQLGVAPSKLSAALKTALGNRIDAAVAAGELTKSEGDAVKARIQAGDFPIFGRPHGRDHRGGPRLDAAATYLGLTDAELRTALEGGKTLAQIAGDKSKSVDGLVQALTDEAKKHLDAAVAAGRLTQAEEQQRLANLPTRITALVNGTGGHRFGFGGPRHGGGGSPLPPAA